MFSKLNITRRIWNEKINYVVIGRCTYNIYSRCCGNTQSKNQKVTTESSSEETSKQENAKDDSTKDTIAENQKNAKADKKDIVVYFSATGTTKGVAENINFCSGNYYVNPILLLAVDIGMYDDFTCGTYFTISHEIK